MSELIEQSFVETQIARLNIPAVVIEELREKSKNIKIQNYEDKKGYEECRALRIEVKNLRCEVEGRRKEVVSSIEKIQKSINAEAQGFCGQLKDIESPLQAQEDLYESEKIRVKQETERKLKERYLKRVSLIKELGFQFHGETWEVVLESDDDPFGFKHIMHDITLNKIEDDAFYFRLNEMKNFYDIHVSYRSEQDRIRREAQAKAEAERVAKEQEEATKRKEEEERLRAEKEALEARVRALEAKEHEQEQREAALKAQEVVRNVVVGEPPQAIETLVISNEVDPDHVTLVIKPDISFTIQSEIAQGQTLITKPEFTELKNNLTIDASENIPCNRLDADIPPHDHAIKMEESEKTFFLEVHGNEAQICSEGSCIVISLTEIPLLIAELQKLI